jgi:hypothetical protein
MKLFMNKVLQIVFLFSLIMLFSCSDDSDELFMSKIRGKSFKSIDNDYILWDGEKLIIIEGIRLELYTKQDNDCWERAVPPFYLKENYQYSAWFESVADRGGLVGVHKREDGGVRIVLWGNEFDAERTSSYCIE